MKVDPKTKVKITDPLEMVGFLRANGTQCQFVSLLTVTEPKLTVDCPYKGVRKVARRNGNINADYNTSVRRRIAKHLGVPLADAEYTNGKSAYIHETTLDGKPLPLMVKKSNPTDGVFYLQYFPLHSSSKYVLPNGESVTEEQLKPYFYARGETPRFKPPVTAPKISNIKELRCYRVIMQTNAAEQAASVLTS